MKFEVNENSHHKNNDKIFIKNILIIIIIFFLIAFSIISITYYFLSKGNDNKQQTKASTELTTTETEKKEISIYNINSNERPISFIIDNNEKDINYAGLQTSYINYEIMSKSGQTKILSIYKDKNQNLIGPIGKLDEPFIDYALEHDAIVTYYGITSQADITIKSTKVDVIDGKIDKTAFRRDDSSKSPYNVFTNIEYMKDIINKKEYSKTSNNWKLLTISAEDVTPKNETKTNKVNINYSNDEYRTYNYDESNNYYLRSQNGSAHIDRQSKKQLHYKNIIVIKVNNQNAEEQTIKTTGTGTGYYISNGYSKEISWSKEKKTSKTIFKNKDGTELKINDGNTFIHIISLNNNITIE